MRPGSLSGDAMTRIGILAGGGRLPLMIAESATARGTGVHIVGIRGEADPEIARFPHTWVNWGQIGRMVATLRREGGEHLVIAGGVRRPDLWHVRPDAGFFASLPQIVGLMAAGGDDSVLTRVVRFFERKGLHVRGAHEIAPDLLAEEGALSGTALSGQARLDARIGFAVRRLLGRLDAGQSVVVADGRVLAIEGAEGTDRMLERVLGLPGREEAGSRQGVLAKGPKPGQELRIDMPAIGPRTIDSVVAAGLEGIAVEAGGVLVLDRDQTLRRADANACAIYGLGSEMHAPVPDPALRALRARLVGRLRPRRRDLRDVERGVAIVERLAEFATGKAVVIARAHVLAVEGAEGTAAMLARVRGLRQWSDRRSRRRIGVLVYRAAEDDTGGFLPLLQQAALQGLAVVAITGRGPMLERAREEAQTADNLGLCLLTCESGAGGERTGTA
jgi:UDP-2,3-diacylglucosamine hydrolase